MLYHHHYHHHSTRPRPPLVLPFYLYLPFSLPWTSPTVANFLPFDEWIPREEQVIAFRHSDAKKCSPAISRWLNLITKLKRSELQTEQSVGLWPSLSRGAAWTGELMCCGGGGGVGGGVGTASVVTTQDREGCYYYYYRQLQTRGIPAFPKLFHLTYYYFHAITDTSTSVQHLIISYYRCQFQCSH